MEKYTAKCLVPVHEDYGPALVELVCQWFCQMTVHGQADVVFSSSVVRPVHPYRACSSSPDSNPRKKTGGHLLFSILRYITRSVICSDICVLFFATCYLMVQGIQVVKTSIVILHRVSVLVNQMTMFQQFWCRILGLTHYIAVRLWLQICKHVSILYINQNLVQIHLCYLFCLIFFVYSTARADFIHVQCIYMQYMLYNIRPYIRFCVGIQRKKPASALPHIALTNAPLLRDGTKVHSLRC